MERRGGTADLSRKDSRESGRGSGPVRETAWRPANLSSSTLHVNRAASIGACAGAAWRTADFYRPTIHVDREARIRVCAWNGTADLSRSTIHVNRAARIGGCAGTAWRHSRLPSADDSRESRGADRRLCGNGVAACQFRSINDSFESRGEDRGVCVGRRSGKSRRQSVNDSRESCRENRPCAWNAWRHSRP
jgi:hypothetical protein